MAKKGITTSSTAEYFAKNLQQVGFSSLTKSVLTTLKESVDNALDACEDEGIAPEIWIDVERKGTGSLKGSEKVKVKVSDNGPGIHPDDVPKVFGEYLASSKFGRGRCSRGQQGIGISAATTWAQLTNAHGAKITTKTKKMRKALRCEVEVDIRKNQGQMSDKEMIDWKRDHGTEVEFIIDGRVQMNGEAGLLSYIMGNVLVNPHLKLHYKVPGMEKRITIDRVSDTVPRIPSATVPHPHTMKLGEFIAYSHLAGKTMMSKWLKKDFSRISDQVISDFKKISKLPPALFNKPVDKVSDDEFKDLYKHIQKMELRPPATSSVMSIGEEGLAHSIGRIGNIDFFSVVSRKPAICDFKPVLVEVAIARLKDVKSEEEPVQVLRFANRVPLQFDKASCAIVKALTSVNWKSYGLSQPKRQIPQGPYIIAVSVTSPFIKFKNASKETIDASDELVEEIRRALMQAGQRLSRHIKREHKEAALETKIQHIEQFGPILIDGLMRITKSKAARKKKAEDGLKKLLGRDSEEAKAQVKTAVEKLDDHLASQRKRLGITSFQDAATVAKEKAKAEKQAAKEAEAEKDSGENGANGSKKKSAAPTKKESSSKSKAKPKAKKSVKKKPVKKAKKKGGRSSARA